MWLPFKACQQSDWCCGVWQACAGGVSVLVFVGRQSSRRVYVGGLPLDVRSSEVKDIFSKFGPIKDVDVKVPRGGPGTTKPPHVNHC